MTYDFFLSGRKSTAKRCTGIVSLPFIRARSLHPIVGLVLFLGLCTTTGQYWPIWGRVAWKECFGYEMVWYTNTINGLKDMWQGIVEIWSWLRRSLFLFVAVSSLISWVVTKCCGSFLVQCNVYSIKRKYDWCHWLFNLLLTCSFVFIASSICSWQEFCRDVSLERASWHIEISAERSLDVSIDNHSSDLRNFKSSSHVFSSDAHDSLSPNWSISPVTG